MDDETEITIEYEDGTVVQGVIPEGLLISSAKWIDWLVANNDPRVQND